MAQSGAFAARVAEVEVSNAASSDPTSATYVAVEKCNSPSLSGTQDTAESSNNDSSGNREFLSTWKSLQLTFEIIADESATGQEHLWTAFLAGEIRAFKLVPHGSTSGDKRFRFLGIITSLEETLDKGDVAKYRVTVQRTGTVSTVAV